MKKMAIDVFVLLSKVRQQKPVIHHLTNWVTIYDCAQVVKTLGASPVMAHAPEEVEQMAGIASALVLNIGTLTIDFIESMKKAGSSANKKGIPVVLDVCGAGATQLRDEKCSELLDCLRIDIIKGNASEIARVAGLNVQTKGVDATQINQDMIVVAQTFADKRNATVVVTGKEDIVTDGNTTYMVKNGHEMMSRVVGTGCMAASVIGTFAAIEKNLLYAATAGLVSFEVAAECAMEKAKGPATFKEAMFDCLFVQSKAELSKNQKVYKV